MIKILIFSSLLFVLNLFLAGATEGCEQRIEGPLYYSKEEFYKRYMEQQGVSREEVFEILKKTSSDVRFYSETEKKFFNQVARSDYVFVAAILEYEADIWPTGVLPEILELSNVDTQWIVLETLMGKKENVTHIYDQTTISVYLQSGYLFHKASGKGAYELAVEYSAYLKEILEEVDNLYDRFSKREIKSRELRELEEVFKRDREKIIYGDFYYPNRIARASEMLREYSRLCDFNAIIPGEPYIITLNYKKDIDQYRFATDGPSVFPMSYKSAFQKAIENRMKMLD